MTGRGIGDIVVPTQHVVRRKHLAGGCTAHDAMGTSCLVHNTRMCPWANHIGARFWKKIEQLLISKTQSIIVFHTFAAADNFALAVCLLSLSICIHLDELADKKDAEQATIGHPADSYIFKRFKQQVFRVPS